MPGSTRRGGTRLPPSREQVGFLQTRGGLAQGGERASFFFSCQTREARFSLRAATVLATCPSKVSQGKKTTLPRGGD